MNPEKPKPRTGHVIPEDDSNPLRFIANVGAILIVWYVGLALGTALVKLSWRMIQAVWETIP